MHQNDYWTVRVKREIQDFVVPAPPDDWQRRFDDHIEKAMQYGPSWMLKYYQKAELREGYGKVKIVERKTFSVVSFIEGLQRGELRAHPLLQDDFASFVLSYSHFLSEDAKPLINQIYELARDFPEHWMVSDLVYAYVNLGTDGFNFYGSFFYDDGNTYINNTPRTFAEGVNEFPVIVQKFTINDCRRYIQQDSRNKAVVQGATSPNRLQDVGGEEEGAEPAFR